jgi:chitin disaccharide deacetylase
MKYLIVNADDFGASRGINRGVVEAHCQGILTSTSLLVTAPFSQEAALLAQKFPELSVGLHVDLGPLPSSPSTEVASGDWRSQLRGQFIRFRELLGDLPTHIDSHRNVHRDPRVLPLFLELAQDFGLPLREHSPVRYYSKFYGQWGGKSHLEQISASHLAHILENDIGPGVTELSCHPGYLDPDFRSGYLAEREAELNALCDPTLRDVLQKQSIQLVGYHQLGKIEGCVYA